MAVSRRTHKFLYSFFFLLSFLLLMVQYHPAANDDIFIYFNYAQNMSEGSFFAYDARNIPSEGFTSLIYLLLLTPFEFFNISMMFSTFVINSIAIVITCYLLYRLLEVSQLFSSDGAVFAIVLFIVAVFWDRDPFYSINWGLETYLGPLVAFSATLALAYSSPPYLNQKAVTRFFVAVFISYLIRPEITIFLALFGIPLLYTIKPHRKRLLFSIISLAIVFIIYHVLKLLIFGDLMPTSFYRKVGTNADFGLSYVIRWIYSNWPVLITLFIILFMALARSRSLLKSRWLWFIIGVCLGIIVFFSRSNPLVGVGYRFLIIPTFTMYLLISTSLVILMEKKFNVKRPTYLKILIAIIGIFIIHFIRLSTEKNLIEELNIYAKSEESISGHYYVQFGSQLHQQLSNPEEITLVFGDAGAIPYTLKGVFIDTNGLTEPTIAHMFHEPDGIEKTQAYIDYIISYAPDIVVLTVGNIPANGVVRTVIAGSSPFRTRIPIELYIAYQEHQIVYTCSLSSYDDLHIGLRKNSLYYDELRTILLSMCTEQGYILENGLTITDDTQSVVFSVDEG